MSRIVILRPEPGATLTAERAAEAGLEATKFPLFEIERLAWAPPSDLAPYDGLLVTSANAFREGGPGLESLKSLPVYAVGKVTAEAGRAAGFTIAKTGLLNVRHLLKAIAPDLRLLHLAGEDRIDTKRFFQAIDAIPVYRARAIEPVDGGALDNAIVLVHSPRAGRRLAEVANDKSSITVAALSKAAADACGSGWAAVKWVERPSDVALLALVARLCEKSAG